MRSPMFRCLHCPFLVVRARRLWHHQRAVRGCHPRRASRFHDGDCVPPEAFAESAAEVVDEYRLDENFQNQSGLSHIKADVAYANLRLLKGEDAEPGAGVTIGFIDTGIDLEHPVFAAKHRHQDDRHRGIHAGCG